MTSNSEDISCPCDQIFICYENAHSSRWRFFISGFVIICISATIASFLYLSYTSITDHSAENMFAIIFGSACFGTLVGYMVGHFILLLCVLLVDLCKELINCCCITKNVLSEILLQEPALLATPQNSPSYNSVNIELQ
jgi:hypothetical protein